MGTGGQQPGHGDMDWGLGTVEQRPGHGDSVGGMGTGGGTAWWCHIEDDMVFRRFVHAIEQIPEITSEPGVTLLEEQLLKEARDFIET